MLIGRDAELSSMRAASACVASGQPQVILIGGEAGIGKTTLCSVLATEARSAGQVVLVGHCLNTTEGLPFAPVVDAVRVLANRLGEDPDRPAARRLSRLLDADIGAELQRASLFEALRLAIGEAADRAVVFLWLEDMHWADQSTQDLVLALARTVPGRLVLCLTFRTEALPSGHSFRRALVELGRCPGAVRIDLSGLGTDDVANLARSLTGDAPDSRVRSLLERSDGNPLYIEELVAHSGEGVPATLAELFLNRLEVLPQDARTLMHVASVGGDQIDPPVLAQVSDTDELDVERLLQDALAHHVLRATGETLRFRHGLLREAIYHDLLPSTRKRTHRSFAAIYGRLAEERHREPSLSELIQTAFHASAAGEPDASLVATTRAGVTAQLFGAPEAAQQLRAALELWDHVENPEGLTGLQKPDLLLALARVAEFNADMDQWREAVHQAVALLTPESDRLLASRVYAARGSIPDTSDPEASREAVEEALRPAEGTGSTELARALNSAANRQLRGGKATAAHEYAVRAREVALSAGAPEEEVAALVQLGTLTYLRGECGAGLDHIRAAIDVALRNGMRGEALLQQGHLAWYLLVSGSRTDAAQLAQQARIEAVHAGLPAAAAYCGEQELECLRWDARLDEAVRTLEELLTLGMPVWRWRFFRAESLVERGNVAEALALERETIRDNAKSYDRTHDSDVLRQVRIFLMLGHVEEALDTADAYLKVTEGLELPLLRAAAARFAHQAIAGATATTVVPAVQLVSRAEQALSLAQAAEDPAWSRSYYGLQLRLAEAFALRARGEPALETCRRAGEVATRLGACVAFTPHLLLAEELLTAGQRDEGRVVVIRLWAEASAAGAGGVATEAVKLARRHRIRLDGAASTPAALLALTRREREILDLVETGAPNKVVARQLGISEKTVSVHVTNLMAKLGVSTRGEAAAAKRRIDDAQRESG
jgi:DNA-binding NarL/FixJ family response regulator